MTVAIDITGQRFGYLEALKPTGDRNHGRVIWLFKCHGTTQYGCKGEHCTTTESVRSGRTRSCGCLRRKTASDRTRSDLEGLRFGKLVVLQWSTKTSANKSKYECRCDCGRTKEVLGGHLSTGATTDCGCTTRIRFDVDGEAFTVSEFALILGVPKSTLTKRARSGWSTEEIIAGKRRVTMVGKYSRRKVRTK